MTPHFEALTPAQHERVNLEDLAAMKLAAVGQRGTKRDFFDVHALVGALGSLARLIECYAEKFPVADVMHVRIALVYFDDAESDPDPQMLTATSWDEVRADLRRWVKAL